MSDIDAATFDAVKPLIALINDAPNCRARVLDLQKQADQARDLQSKLAGEIEAFDRKTMATTVALDKREKAPRIYRSAARRLGLVDFATKSLVSGAVIYGVVQDLRGRTFSVADSIQIALRRFLPMLGIAICTTLAIGLGAILFFVPGIILACMYYVSTPVCVAERAGVFASMSRSSFLTKGYRWQVFGTLLLIMIGGVVLGLINGVIFAATGRIGLLISSQVLSAIVGSINGVIIGVFYYELRVAKEGIDIDKMASIFD